MNAVKTNLKRLRLARGMTQDELAEKLHVVRQTVSSWETGKTTPDVETLTAIAGALDADITELIYGPRPVDTAAAARAKQVKRAVFLCILTMLLALLAASWENILAQFGITSMFNHATFRPDTRNTILISICGHFVPSLAYCLAGASVLAVLRLWRPLELPNRPLCFLFVLLGAAPLLFYWCLIVGFDVTMISAAWQAPSHLQIDTNVLLWFYYRQYVFFLSGILIAFGFSPSTRYRGA